MDGGLLRFAIRSPGDSLQRHVVSASNAVYRVEQWRVFCSNTPLTAVFALQWFRLLCFLVGLWMLARPPTSHASLGWLRGSESLPEAVTRRAQQIRFRAVCLRNGACGNVSHGLSSFGLVRKGCRVSSGRWLAGEHPSSSTLAFPEEVEFDGWYLVTGAGSRDLDADVYSVEEWSPGVGRWVRIAASWQRCAFPDVDSREAEDEEATEAILHADVIEDVPRRLRARGPAPLPAERGAEMVLPFNSHVCLGAYYAFVGGEYILAASFIVAPCLAIVRGPAYQHLPVQVRTRVCLCCAAPTPVLLSEGA